MARHDAGEALVIPVILRPVDWKNAPFGKLQALPQNAEPVTIWPSRDLAFENVTKGIRKVVEQLKSKSINSVITQNIPAGEVEKQSSNLSVKEHENSKVTLGELVRRVRQFSLTDFNLKTMLMVSLTLTVVVIGLRLFGHLEFLELKAFDNLMQLRPDEDIDQRLLIVKITDADISAQDNRGEKGQGSLRDPSLNKLLEILQQYHPRVIGLDLYRPFSADSQVPGLIKQLKEKNFVTVCKVPTTDVQVSPEEEGNPPKEVPAENIGFSDFVADLDNTVRRNLMSMDKVGGANCQPKHSFSLLLAHRYLLLEPGGEVKYKKLSNSSNNIQLGSIVFERLQPFAGGYQDVDNSGEQVLLNYRATSSRKVAKEFTVEDVFNNKVKQEDVGGKIVLIGSYPKKQEPSDLWSTPYGTIPGVMVHAHMVSQILSTVLCGRPLLRVWFPGGEIIWIWGWSLLGGLSACYWRSPKPLGIAISCELLVLYITCWTSLTMASFWIPLIPSALTLVGTSSVVMYIASISRQRRTKFTKNL